MENIKAVNIINRYILYMGYTIWETVHGLLANVSLLFINEYFIITFYYN